MSSVRFHRHFLSWERPWLPQIAAWLGREWDGTGPLDLSRTVALVPTRQSARRLREALAEHAARHGAAVFPPRAHTPDTLLALASEGAGVATRLEALLAWSEVLRGVDLATVPAVFPVAPPRRDFAWSWRLAESLFRLQSQLTEAGLGFADVAPRAGPEFPEGERWRQLTRLEQLQIEALAARDRVEPHAARRAFAADPVLPPEIERVVVLASPDPLPLLVGMLDRWAGRVPVDVVVFGPPEATDLFDAAGRPVPDAWAQRVIALADFERRVHVVTDPAAEASRATEIIQRYPAPDGHVAVGLADPDVLPRLEHTLARAGIGYYNPEGRVRRSEGLYTLLAALAALAREASFDTVAALARCPDFLASLQERYGADFSVADFLEELDDLRAEHLPADLDQARRVVPGPESSVARGLQGVADLHAVLRAEEFPASARAALQLVFGNRRLDLRRADDARVAEAAAAWRDVMRECAAARDQFAGLESDDAWEVALRLYGDSRRTEEKPDAALELQGWLELLWEDAPHLIVAGMNDGLVPDAIVGDPFLPESLRARLGLRSNAARFARDAYLLEAMATSRAQGGRLDVLLARASGGSDPLRPSRLLLRCDDAQLPARIDFLFRPAASEAPEPPWTRAWKLIPRRLPPPAKVPVTGLRTWLACPFRFYLTQVLRMEPVDPEKTEMDARDFGTLCHAALEAMARAPALRDCVDEATLREFLLAEFDRVARARFGEQLTLPLVVQLESARQRLGKVAALQAAERAAGWVVQRVEWAFSLDVGGLEVRGKIDRIDRHETTGAWRVLDYKTSDTAVPPVKSHLRPQREGEDVLPDWMRVNVDGRDCVWADLQLPMYIRAIAADAGGAGAVSCGYINLPKAASETALALWPELSGDLLAAAQACTDGVAGRIRAGEFWPPVEMDADRDPFGSLFHQGAAESIAWEAPS